MPGLELKSWRTFLAIKRCQRTKIQKVIKLARSSNKKWLQIQAIAVKLLVVMILLYNLRARMVGINQLRSFYMGALYRDANVEFVPPLVHT